MRRVLAVWLVLATPVWAEEVPGADIEQVWVDPAGRGSMSVGNGLTLKGLEFRVGAATFFTHGNLRVTDLTLLQSRFGFQVFGAVGVNDWLEVGAVVPLFAFQDGARGVASAGLGNPWLYAKVNLLDDTHALQAAAGLGVGLPVGTTAAQGNGGFEVAPRLQVGKVYNTWQWGAELGLLYRPVTDFTPLSGGVNDKVGSQVWLSGTATSVSTSGPRGEVTLRLHAPLTGGRVGGEGQLGVRWPLGDLELFASMGPGFGGAPTTPDVRVYVGAAFANTPLSPPPCVEGRPYVLANCPDLDRDGDGVKNASDRAPLSPEDRDGFEDEDGVPDPDNDGDGVPDTEDRCVSAAGPAANRGCPDTDTDHDGVVDRLDKCVNEPEDKDGFEDQDGCPDPDNDGDGIADAKDACPREAGIIQERGCPVKDGDGDGVFDFEDNCPAEKGEKGNAGCPMAQKQLVLISGEALRLLDKVYFEGGKAALQRRSNALLDNVAQVMAAHGELVVQVEGHTDNQGNPETNKALSQERADAVKSYLAKKGIAESRIKAVGFGQERPTDPNDTPAGRENNRRVEFNIIRE